MLRSLSIICLIYYHFCCFGQYAPKVGEPGSSSIHKDSSIFKSWATSCNVIRGFMDISDTSLGRVSSGDSSMALGIAGANGTVSLGDGGIATLGFNNSIINGPGWDFAVFENSFDDNFLELAYVEVSSDGVNFFRFPSASMTQYTLQVNGFGYLDATNINNLAGKYRALHGTPFDLEELANIALLDINKVSHVRLIDVVGSINDEYANYDSYGNKINDPWKTPFASGGFDLDAIGVINQSLSSVHDYATYNKKLSIYPNPISKNSSLEFFTTDFDNAELQLYSYKGHCIINESIDFINNSISYPIYKLDLKAGFYLITITSKDFKASQKLILTNE